jgi:hypothetical protein
LDNLEVFEFKFEPLRKKKERGGRGGAEKMLCNKSRPHHNKERPEKRHVVVVLPE